MARAIHPQRRLRLGSAVLIGAVWLSICHVSAADLPQARAIPGGIAIVPLASACDPTPVVIFQNQRVMVRAHDGRWHAIVGLPLSLAAGEHHVVVTDAADAKRTIPFSVQAHEYGAQYITLKNKRQVEPNPADLKRIAREQAQVRLAFTQWTETDDPPLQFDLPTRGPISGTFGTRRFFNNQPRAPHSGVDIAAPLGAPIRAPAAGVISYIGNYFFNGKTVFLDHGQGLITMYNHLNKISVKPGAKIARGEKIGEVGMTGRVTGPHLHWAASLNNTRVDPLQFVVADGDSAAE